MTEQHVNHPKIVYIGGISPGQYGLGSEMSIVAQFDRPVIVTGIPYINIAIGGKVRKAKYFSIGSNSKLAGFKYIVEAEMSGSEVHLYPQSIHISEDASIKDEDGNDADLEFDLVLSGVNVYSAPLPRLLNLSATTRNSVHADLKLDLKSLIKLGQLSSDPKFARIDFIAQVDLKFVNGIQSKVVSFVYDNSEHADISSISFSPYAKLGVWALTEIVVTDFDGAVVTISGADLPQNTKIVVSA